MAEPGNCYHSTVRVKKLLLTSICRPIWEKYGDAPSVGYELLFGQVTRAQGLFSPRANHIHFSLEYIAENLDSPATVLQYPSKRELIRELRRGYEVVGVSFLLATFHRMKEVVALIRKYSPQSKIVLGGYGTVLSDDVLAPWGDAFCRDEGVAFMRRYLGEPEIPMPYRHPMIVSRLRIFGQETSRTGMVFAGLGCPNGCDFSVFVFSSVRAISQYTVTEILEMGIDGFWIGYEGTRSGFAKQSGRPDLLARVYVNDVEAPAWIPAKDAFYVRAAGLATPMGYGIVAYRDQARAAAFARSRKAQASYKK